MPTTWPTSSRNAPASQGARHFPRAARWCKLATPRRSRRRQRLGEPSLSTPMRNASSVALSLLLSVTVGGSAHAPRGTQVAAPNDNTRAAGTLDRGVLALTIEARRAVWYPDSDSLHGREVMAFAEASRPPLVPGPLVRVPAGTTIALTVRNALERDSIVFVIPAEALSD